MKIISIFLSTIILSFYYSNIIAGENETLFFQNINFVRHNSSDLYSNNINYELNDFSSFENNNLEKNINIYGKTNIFKLSNVNEYSLEKDNYKNIEVNIYGEKNKLNIIKNFDDELLINIGNVYKIAENFDIIMEYQIYNSTYKTIVNSVGTGTISLSTPHGNIKINGS